MIYDWHIVKSVSLQSMEENKPIEVVVDNKVVGLLRKKDTVFAFAAKCPHAGAKLCEGWTDARGLIVCPLHKYRFNPKNGYNASGEGYKLKTYPVEIKEGLIHIGLW